MARFVVVRGPERAIGLFVLALVPLKVEREIYDGEMDWHVTEGVPVLSRSNPLELPIVDAFIDAAGKSPREGVAALRRERPLEEALIDAGAGTSSRAVDFESFE